MLRQVTVTLRDSFSPLRFRNFRIYLTGQAISLIGTWLQITAQGWVVWELSHSAAALGFVAMLNTLPILFSGPWAGVWADRLDRRKVLIFTQIASMILAIALAILIQSSLIQLWHVYILSALLGLVAALDLPSQQAFLGDLAGLAEVRRAVNLNAIIIQISRMIGPALAGIIIATIGTAPAFWLNGISFVPVIASLIVVRARESREKQKSEGALRDFTDGLRALRSHARLQDLLLLSVLVTFLVFPIISIMPAFVGEVLHGDAQTLGSILAASGAGALIGSAILAPLAQAAKRVGVVLTAAVVWMGIWILISASTPLLWVAMVSIFLASMGFPLVFATALGLVQVIASPEMRARLLSLFVTVSFGAQPIAALLVGLSAQAITTALAIEVNGGLLILGGVLFALRPGLRNWRVTAPAAPAEHYTPV